MIPEQSISIGFPRKSTSIQTPVINPPDGVETVSISPNIAFVFLRLNQIILNHDFYFSSEIFVQLLGFSFVLSPKISILVGRFIRASLYFRKL